MVPNGRWTLGGMVPLVKEGNMEMFERILPRLHLTVSHAETDEDFRPTVIDTPFLLAREQEEPNDGQRLFKELTERFMGQQEQKALIVRSRYGSGKTYFLQQLMKRQDMKRVLFITYRQTLARDIMRNFSRLGFKNYLDAPDHPEVWNAPKLIVQLDSLLNVFYKNDRFVCEGRFEKSYDMIILDESESLLNHFDERTMSNKEIQTWNFFDELLKHSRKVVLMDGDVSRRSLSFAKTYGELTYIKNTNADGQKTLNLMLDEGMWRTQLHGDLERYFGEDPGFRVCVVSQSSSMAVGLEQEIKEKHPYLKVQRLVGTDSGESKRQFMENINETLQDANVFIYSPVIESGVDITLPVKKLYGALCSRSNSQRAYLQMLARCRRVEESRIDILNDSSLKVNNNYNFWRYDEVLELNKALRRAHEPRVPVGGRIPDAGGGQRQEQEAKDDLGVQHRREAEQESLPLHQPPPEGCRKARAWVSRSPRSPAMTGRQDRRLSRRTISSRRSWRLPTSTATSTRSSQRRRSTGRRRSRRTTSARGTTGRATWARGSWTRMSSRLTCTSRDCSGTS
jgi:hypothetical protein